SSFAHQSHRIIERPPRRRGCTSRGPGMFRIWSSVVFGPRRRDSGGSDRVADSGRKPLAGPECLKRCRERLTSGRSEFPQRRTPMRCLLGLTLTCAAALLLLPPLTAQENKVNSPEPTATGKQTGLIPRDVLFG